MINEVLMKRFICKASFLQPGKSLSLLFLFCLFALSLACRQSAARVEGATKADNGARAVTVESPTVKKVIDAAIEQTNITRSYDPSYVKLAYPNGDVPMQTGV